MNKKVIYKRHCMWYDKRYPWNLFDDLAVYIKYSLRFYIQWLEKYCDDEELLHEVLTKFSKATGCQDKNKHDLLCVLEKMYFSFDQASMDFPDSPWNIWWNENCAEHALQNFRRENGYVTYEVACETPDSVKEAQKEYNSAIDEGIKSYANLVEFISGTNVNNGYCITKKARNHTMKRIDPVINKPYAFGGDDQAWYIYEGLVAFKNAKRYGVPCDLSEDDWDKYLDDMIFTFHEITHCHESSDEYDAEEYEKKCNRGKELFGKYFLGLWD